MIMLAEARETASAAIDAASPSLRELSLDIHAHPELSFEEHHAHRVLTSYLGEAGFEVECGAFEMPTAFRATFGSGTPTLAVFCEYDALPGIGHACGHNLIAISGIAWGLGLEAALGEGNGSIVILGSPAEEGGGGKVYIAERGGLDGVDAAMMLHPAPAGSAWSSLIAREELHVSYRGRNAHAGAAPWMGVNALDALVTAYTAISSMRQQMRPTDRVHGVITNGGVKPNIIPDLAAAEYYVRSRTMAELEELRAKVVGCFEGAALTAGCSVEVETIGKTYAEVVNNDPMAEAYRANMAALGVDLPGKSAGLDGIGGASTDMGNISYLVPSIHPSFAIPAMAVNHTAGFTEAAATPRAHENTIRAAKALAHTAIDLIANPALLQEVKAAFTAR
ncbi:MAG: M20 family metallopeptidase [Dehalococcoidia bacterium]|nr:M20 family metallopeptidase [Dehalococcoidia bacterium]